MNVMNIVSVVMFLILGAGVFVAYRFLHREVEESDGACGINELGETGFSDEGDIVGEVQSVSPK